MKVLTALKHAGVYLRARGSQKPLHRAATPYIWEAAYLAGISWHFEVKPRPVYTLLDDAIAAYPNRTCLRFQGKKYSYRKVGKLVGKVANGLRKFGVRRGTKVGVFLPNSLYFVICYYGVLKAGAPLLTSTRSMPSARSRARSRTRKRRS